MEKSLILKANIVMNYFYSALCFQVAFCNRCVFSSSLPPFCGNTCLNSTRVECAAAQVPAVLKAQDSYAAADNIISNEKFCMKLEKNAEQKLFPSRSQTRRPHCIFIVFIFIVMSLSGWQDSTEPACIQNLNNSKA